LLPSRFITSRDNADPRIRLLPPIVDRQCGFRGRSRHAEGVRLDERVASTAPCINRSSQGAGEISSTALPRATVVFGAHCFNYMIAGIFCLVRRICGSLIRSNSAGKARLAEPANPLPGCWASASFRSQLPFRTTLISSINATQNSLMLVTPGPAYGRAAGDDQDDSSLIG
jgi:hypothetical protein